MTAEYKRINVYGNNLDNADTQGFKSDETSLRSFDEELTSRTTDSAKIGTIDAGVHIGSVSTDLSQGDLEKSDSSDTLAIEGTGFFAVASPGGTTEYTRAGDFQADTSGFLALPSGQRLLDSAGAPISAEGLKVSTDGTFTNSAGQTGTFAVYTGTAAKQTDGFFSLTGAQVSTGSELMQGYEEKSNVDTVTDMTGLVEASRSFQTCEEAYNTATDSLDKLLQIGTLS